jgi:hypothetical protein
LENRRLTAKAEKFDKALTQQRGRKDTAGEIENESAGASD